MPAFEDGELDNKGRPIKVPLTPPQEPERNGLAINSIVAQLETIASSQSQPSDWQKSRERNDNHSEFAYPNEAGTGTSDPTNNAATTLLSDHDSLRKDPETPNLDLTAVNGGNHRMQRTSSEFGASLKEKHYTKRYIGDKLWEITKGPDTSSAIALSPTSLHQRQDGIEATLLPRDRPAVGEGHTLQARSPSLSDASHCLSLDRSLESSKRPRNLTIDVGHDKPLSDGTASATRPRAPRALSTPASVKSPSSVTSQEPRKMRTTSRADQAKPRNVSVPRHSLTSPLPTSIPIPPLSLPTYLQLELSSQRPSQVYIHRASVGDFPYESSRVKIERLLNFLFLPHQLEGVLWFGVLACLDVWLYTFTILPLRMVKSIYLLSKSLANNVATEGRFVADYVFAGSQRMYHRRRARGSSTNGVLSRTSSEAQISQPATTRVKSRSAKHHRRLKSVPSTLLPDHKADLLKGLLIIMTCLILLRLDASRMYHLVRGQGAVKLYVVYNLLEVCDRLLSAIGQDVLECLFSREALERKPDGHSKILRPAWLFLLALTYCVIHATALFYQVVTLNVAVNSYNNALITLLMSNQFVEIKGTVFKKFEKENLFQLTCADIVERFQLWHMLMIIASRNIVETGGLSIGMPHLLSSTTTATSSNPNITLAAPPLTAASILPRSFLIVPSMLSSVSSYVPAISHVLGPFVIVLGSEMFIDWLKHAYISKFNNTKPIIYGRFLDILAKDYYTNAFGDQNMTKRLGLPVIPLSCLMIRAGFQTYQMFVASWVPAPASNDAATLASIHQQYSTTRATPTSTTGMIVRKMDELLSQLPAAISSSHLYSYFTTTLVILLMFLVLLVCKLVLGMGLLAFSRARYASMRERDHSGNPSHHIDGGRRLGGWGVVEVDDDKRRVIYEDDPTALQNLKAREVKDKSRKEQEKDNFGALEKVARFEMVAKRIW